MDDEILFLKETFYDSLLDVLKARKLTRNSIILTFLRMRSNDIMDCLDKASIDGLSISPKVTQTLIAKNYIRGGEDFSQYIITARGVWEIEESLGYISSEILIDFIDQYKFEIEKGGNLEDKEKVVILALISLRCFYEKTPLNRNKESAWNEMFEVLKESRNFLVSMNKIKSFEFTKPSNEDPIEAVFRRSNKLKKHTRGIYCFGGKKHWIDVYDEDHEKVLIDKLGYLLWKIFGGETSIEEQDEINAFCDSILNKYKNYVYNAEERQMFVFSNLSYKNVIHDALFEIIENKVKWENMDGQP
ncbi:hypothetical protein [Methanoculleus sp.]|uniref:hypothetical protein n=1 Tax=Methanoculleus sp. TaxID=90427 RepID=UPI001BD31595|nr:hypothetical protein [Methanoculleus sp.]